MERERYDYVRVQSEQGRDVFVRNPETREEGLVERCADDKVYVRTSDGAERSWDYRQLQELTRDKKEWPRLN
ncbi:MAG: hypothetical protein R6V21_10985 [Pelovirga sp.]